MLRALVWSWALGAAAFAAAPATHACEALLGIEYSDPPETVQISLDGRDWHVGFRKRDAAHARLEYVLADQTVQDFSELVTWRIAFRARTTLATERDLRLDALATACDTLRVRRFPAAGDELLYEWWHNGCYGHEAQHTLVRLVRGEIGNHEITYSKRGRLAPEERLAWLERLSRSKLRAAIPGEDDPRWRAREGYIALWSGDYGRAREILERLAATGDAAAETGLAGLYFEGWGVERDLERAVALLRSAATRGDASAQLRLGTLNARGLGVAADLERAMELYRTAAEAGDATAQRKLANLLLAANAGKPDWPAAQAWAERAAPRDAGAAFELGQILERTWMQPGHRERAIEWYQRAASAGEPRAQYRVGLFHWQGVRVPKNDALAKLWFERAALQGSFQAQTDLASMRGLEERRSAPSER